ncbi:DUF3883 domain-containing protein [Candidatus Poribacteria bacterium]|nr:DUF3883 domain-containing protein [Candidatus Poribacteria bacterium]
MATDYKKIAEENQVRYGSDPEYRRFFYEQLYKEKTHFVYEFIQNAVDSKSSQLELRLGENELFVWNDGDQFSEKDVRSICSLGSSSKDLTQIGTFGIGFKSVYNYTDCPEIYSDDEHFRIRDLTQPEGIDKTTPQIVEQVSQGRTVFRLPFKDDLSQEDIVLLKDQFCKLGERYVLLFLRDLQRDFKKDFKTIRWIDEREGRTGICSCIHHPHSKIQDASEVELTMSLNGENQLSEMFLVFHKAVQPPENVIDALLKQTKHDEKRQKIQQSAKKQQPIEIAFKLHDGSITAMDDNSVLFAYLPTQKETHLKFLIQARYQTTSGRADIQDPSENPWNKWLVQETAKFLPKILEQLKVNDLLEPAFFNILPLKGEVENEFKPIADALQKAMQERVFVPTQDGGYAKAENVFYPHRESLRELVESRWLYPNSGWLHPEIGETEEFRRCFKVMREAGVREIGISQVLGWLEKQDNNWFESRCEEWLRFLYVYLNSQNSELGRIKRLPLVRLENGRHVSTNYKLVFFPPDTDEGREDLKPFLMDLPILQSILLKGEEGNDIKAFLGKLDVRISNSEEMISKWIIRQYRWSDKPSKEQNRLHVRYIFRVWNELSGNEHRQLREELSKVSILLAYNSRQPETYDFVKPCDIYLPKAYTGNADLETYFSVSNSDIWFVDDTYLENDSNRRDWLQFLKAIGAMDIPCVIEKNISAKSENDQAFNKELSKRNVELERTTWGLQTNIKDFNFPGLSEALVEISDHKKINLSHVLWHLLVKRVKPLPSGEWNRQTFFDNHFRGIYRWYFRKNQSKLFDATFYCQLKETAWIPDEHGKLHTPSKCFAPTDGNRRVLGESVAYLHPDFDISQDNEAARWLAEKLGIHLNANTDSVLNYLQTLSGTEVSVEKVEPLYRFLARQDARRSEEFKQKPLIFTSNPEPNWWKAHEVFWKDESPVFGNHCGYLIDDYEETLKGFFIGLGVLEGAAPSHYVRVIQKIASVGKTEDVNVRERVKILYHRLWQALREGGSFLVNEDWWKEWGQVLKDKCWLGEEGDKWDFFCLRELVWKDDDYRSRLFMEEHIPFWSFDGDLLEFAKQHLRIEGCCEASDVEFNCSGEQREDRILSEKVRNLRPYIHDFLHSQRLCQGHEVKKSAEILDRMSVCRTEKLEVEYTLREFRAPDPNPRQSFLDERNQTLWLGLEEDEKAYPDLIGDALQDYFRIDQLREFVKDLLSAVNLSNTALLSWKRRGFQPNCCLLPPESDSKEDEENASESVDEKCSCETGSEDDLRPNDSDVGTPTIHEEPETGSENNDSTENEFETSTSQSHPGGSRTRSRGGKGINTPNRNRDTSHSSGRSGGTEDDTHMVETSTSPHDRKEIEHIGMKHAREYEEERERTVKDVSTKNLGYDLHSTAPDGKNRYIEVKARAYRDPVLLTSNEWSVAQELKDDYFLYIVLNAATQPELYIIQNPTDKVSPMEDVRYQVPLSEITAHGIPV